MELAHCQWGWVGSVWRLVRSFEVKARLLRALFSLLFCACLKVTAAGGLLQPFDAGEQPFDGEDLQAWVVTAPAGRVCSSRRRPPRFSWAATAGRG